MDAAVGVLAAPMTSATAGLLSGAFLCGAQRQAQTVRMAEGEKWSVVPERQGM